MMKRYLKTTREKTLIVCVLLNMREITTLPMNIRQVIDKYLVQDRILNIIYETPQYMYMMIAATLFAKYPKNKR